MTTSPATTAINAGMAPLALATRLPRHLAPWQAQLALFPDDMALVIGALVSRLAQLAGPWHESASRAGEPNGYSGIARRGAYEQLIASEWLLLDELPDEFLRRVVSGEHAFLERAYTEAGAGKRCVALFDAGVDQLGAPRLAHIALLVLLAQRASQHHAQLVWGIVQDDAMQLHEGVSEATMRNLVRSRYARPAATTDIARWAAALQGDATSEVWLVGAAAMQALGLEVAAQTSARVSVAIVSDVLEPAAPARLRVAMRDARERGGTSRWPDVVLDLPHPQLAVRLLRDPFASAAAAPQVGTGTPVSIDVNSALVFAQDSRRLYVRSQGGGLVTFILPNSPRGKAPPPSVLVAAAGNVVIAVGSRGKHAFFINQHGRDLYVNMLSRRGASVIHSVALASQSSYSPALVDASTPLQPLSVGPDDKLTFPDAAGCLLFLSARGDLVEPVLTLQPVAAFTPLGLTAAWAGCEQATATRPATFYLRGTSFSEPPAPIAIDPTQPIFFGHGLQCYAYADDTGHWHIVSTSEKGAETTIKLKVPEAWTPIGVIGFGWSRPMLLALDASRRHVRVVGADPVTTLFSAPAPIARAVVDPSGRFVAFITTTSEVGVYATDAAGFLLRWSPAGTSHANMKGVP